MIARLALEAKRAQSLVRVGRSLGCWINYETRVPSSRHP
jgi:hypothetical protein